MVARRPLLAIPGLVGLLLVAGLVAYGQLRASLPRLSGELVVRGLTAPATVTRDALGVPTVTAGTSRDATFALGFLHAQERFFQMDLSRRQPAGELAALIGGAAVRGDRLARRHAFRTRARTALARATAAQRDLLDAYVAGVNAGLAAQRRPACEYLLLRQPPEPWRPEDSYLVLFAMFNLLNEENESARGTLEATLPHALADFLAPRGGEWDAPLIGEPFTAPPPPGPDVVDLRRAPVDNAAGTIAARRGGGGLGALPGLRGARRAPGPAVEEPPGSNSWALTGFRARDGGALVANDMHLGLGVPNIWYRAVLTWSQGGAARRLVGVTLPGVPGLVVGSNGRVAWGFTNAMADVIDLVVVEPDPADSNRYLAAGGPLPFACRREIIAVRGAPADTVELLDTIWGPVTGRDRLGRRLAMRWVAHDPDGANLALLGLADVLTVDEALALAPRCGMPPQNLVCADADGRIAWTVFGRLPRRVGFDGRVPVSWAEGGRGWDGVLPEEQYPRVVDPPEGRLWTANNRTVDGAGLAALGDGGFITGARARQIRDDLRALEQADPRDLLRIQLDDRALFLERWRGLLLDLLNPAALAGAPGRAEFRVLLETSWSGRATVEAVGYRLVRGFRLHLRESVYGWLTAPCAAADPGFTIDNLGPYEDPLWALATQRPPHLLDPRLRSWDDALLAVVDTTIVRLTRGGRPLASRTWGERNTAAIRHPLSLAVPQLGRWLDMPRTPLPGDSNLPRVQSSDMGASERMVVSPGREEAGLFHMPTGQSGHPLSPYYRRGHAAWEHGEATPLLPGPAVWTLRLAPQW
jgi:penicillin G amidase